MMDNEDIRYRRDTVRTNGQYRHRFTAETQSEVMDNKDISLLQRYSQK